MCELEKALSIVSRIGRILTLLLVHYIKMVRACHTTKLP